MSLDEKSEKLELLKSPDVNFVYYLLHQIGNPFRVAWVFIKLGYEPFPSEQLRLPLSLLGSKSSIYVYPNILTYTYRTAKQIGLWNILSSGLFANACFDFSSELFNLALRRRAVAWKQWHDDPESFRTSSGGDVSSTSSFSNELTSGQYLMQGYIDALMETSPLNLYFHMLSEAVVLRIWEVLITQPFYGKLTLINTVSETQSCVCVCVCAFCQ